MLLMSEIKNFYFWSNFYCACEIEEIFSLFFDALNFFPGNANLLLFSFSHKSYSFEMGPCKAA